MHAFRAVLMRKDDREMILAPGLSFESVARIANADESTLISLTVR
jgi:hypothetical protein